MVTRKATSSGGGRNRRNAQPGSATGKSKEAAPALKFFGGTPIKVGPPKEKAKPKKETATASSAPQVERPTVKRESGQMAFTGRFRESAVATAGDGRRFGVTLIQEGLGNLNDAFYYTAQAIESCVPIFEGKKFFVDHPTSVEEEVHPERSVRDVAGYFENLKVELDDDGRANLNGDCVLLQGRSVDHFRALMLENLDYAKKHPGQCLIGLSINASGDFETVEMSKFIASETIPESAMAKLMEAKAAGVSVIHPVREMKSAFSCDLVTEPGAGGSINTLMEGAKKMEKKEESKQEEGKKHEGADGAMEHDDEQQDKELIKSELKKHLGIGDDDKPSEEEEAAMHQAYEESKAMGMDHEEAMKCAGYNLKMAKHLQAKAKESDDGTKAGADAFGAKPKAVGDAGHAKDQHSEAKKESAAGTHRDVKLAAEVAALRAELDSRKLDEHIDKTMRESKLPSAATKKFRECIKGVKTVKEVDEKFAVFSEAYRMGGAADSGLILSVERAGGSDGAEGGLSFADCLEE